MCCSSTAAKSPMAQFLKSQTPDQLWKASLQPKDPLKPDDPAKPANPFDPVNGTQSLQAAKAPGIKALGIKTPGIGLVLDTSA